MTSMEPVRTVARERRAASCNYALYDLCVSSEVPLFGAPMLLEATSTPDVVVQRIDSMRPLVVDQPAVAEIACPVHGPHMREYRDASGVWIWLQAIGTFHVAPDGRQVDVYPDAGVDERMLSLALDGPVLLFVRHLRGYPTLHASAVVTPRGVVAFLGPRGRGKSTMAATFLRRGAALLTDDALPLIVGDGDIYVVPGPPIMKLWSATAQHALEMDDELPNLMAASEKKLLTLSERYPLTAAPVRLHALYLLDRYDPIARGHSDVALRRLSQRDSLLAMMAYTSNRDYLLPSDEAPFLPIYARLAAQAPVCALAYPHGFEYQDTVHGRILADLEAL
jgi:hypothetical protein